MTTFVRDIGKPLIIGAMLTILLIWGIVGLVAA
jgi:hypothetical protein